jgi:hypothetical protein
MTLFQTAATDNTIFKDALRKYFDGKPGSKQRGRGSFLDDPLTGQCAARDGQPRLSGQKNKSDQTDQRG